MEIRKASKADSAQLWAIYQQVIAGEDVFMHTADTTYEVFEAYWMAPDTRTYVAVEGDAVCGSYILRDNKAGLGNHIGNAGYMVSEKFRGRKIGKLLGEHSLAEAKRLGYEAMQYNEVVATNKGAIKLWQQLGFEIVGKSPGGFRHRKYGRVDLLVMYRTL